MGNSVCLCVVDFKHVHTDATKFDDGDDLLFCLPLPVPEEEGGGGEAFLILNSPSPPVHICRWADAKKAGNRERDAL